MTFVRINLSQKHTFCHNILVHSLKVALIHLEEMQVKHKMIGVIVMHTTHLTNC
jgi:hypothetical protein